MPEETSAGTGVMPETGTPATGSTASSGATPAKQATTLEEALAKIAELEHSHNNAREQANRQAQKLSAYEKQEEARKLAALGDLEKAQKQAADAQKQLETYKQELVNAQVKLAAKDKGIIDPDIAALALKDKLEYGDDGMPSNLEKALDDLIKAKPYLLAQAQSAAQTASTQRAPTTPANNPGRSSIVQPGSSTMQPGKVTTWHDVYSQNRNK